MRRFPLFLVNGLSVGLLLAVTGCGGGGGSSTNSSGTTPPSVTPPVTPPITMPDNSNVNFSAGGTVQLDAGVTLRIQEGSGTGGASIVATASGEPGAMDGVSQVVSAEFDITSVDLKRGDLTAPILVTLPISSQLVNTDADPMSFDVQVYNTETAQWDWVDGWTFYDAQTQDVSFWTGHFSRYRVLHSEPSDRDNYERYSVKSRNFSVIYYEADNQIFGMQYPYAPPTDAAWKPVSGGTSTNADVPDYIEDVDEALEDALAYYLGMTTSSGAKLFSEPTTQLDAYVTYLPKKDSSGDSKFSIMRLATSLENYSDMAATATHELAHVMSNQYYTVFGAAYNRWFFEATADLWTSRALGMSRSEQISFFSRLKSTYLKVPLDASDEGSYYAAADFLHWLEKETGKNVSADVVSADYAKDLTGLNTIVTSEDKNLSDYFTDYVLEASVGDHDLNVVLVERVNVLDKNRAGVQEEVDVHHLSAKGLAVRGSFDVDALLVVSAESDLSDSDIKTFSYLSRGLPVDDADKFYEESLPEDGAIVIENFGQSGSSTSNNILYQIAINPTLADSEKRSYTFESYVLLPPLMQISEGVVDFTSDAIYASGQAPINGFNVYLAGQKLNTTLLAADAHQLRNVSIHSGSDVVVTVVDHKGNEWPKLNSTLAPKWEMLVDIDPLNADISRCPRSESSIARLNSTWIPVSMTSDGNVTFSHNWALSYGSVPEVHLEGLGTYADNKLRVRGSWNVYEKRAMVLGQSYGYEKEDIGTFTLGGHFTGSFFFNDTSASMAQASTRYTVYTYHGSNDDYVADEPQQFPCDDQHPTIYVSDFRQK